MREESWGEPGVAEQEAMIAELEALSRRRALAPAETDLLAELLRRADQRTRQHRHRLPQCRARAEARLTRLAVLAGTRTNS